MQKKYMALFHAPNHFLRRPMSTLKQITGTALAATVLATTVLSGTALWTIPAWASDPFRTTNPHPIGNQTEAAFRAIFEEGNYVEAQRLLRTAEPNEPLAHALEASLAYLNQDWSALSSSATLTRETAERLVATDPLRGHLYTAVGYFLEGGYALTTQGTLDGTPAALSKLQQVFDQLKQAEAINPNDPELNLLKGYMDLLLAVNLPFSDPADAIERLQTLAAPSYLVHRGIAIGYRDLSQHDQSKRADYLNQALTSVDQALTETPHNPDLLYLKAQILVLQQNDRASLPFFQQAMGIQGRIPTLIPRRMDFFKRAIANQQKLLPALARQLTYEWCRATDRANSTPNRTDCNSLRRA